ncbi:MAG: DUF1684 domain-containing protein [Bacteroidia bacterium]
MGTGVLKAISILGLFCLYLASLGVSQTSEKAYLKQIKKHRKHIHQEFKNPETSPLREEAKQFHGLDYYAPDPEYKVEATLTLTPEAKPFYIPTSNPNRSKQFVSYATLSFTLKGKPWQLTVYRNLELAGIKKYEKLLFLPFLVETSGFDTYGGGRYMDLEIPDGDKITLDFNLCYNPYCAYSGGWSCPIPPPENFLELNLEAGVKKYQEH